MKKILFFIASLLLVLIILVIININQKTQSSIGQYNGTSTDNKWNMTFEVYYKNNGQITVMGELICNEQDFLQPFSDDEFMKMQVSLYKKDGERTSLIPLKDGVTPNKFIIINYAINDKEIYKKAEIILGNYSTFINIEKFK